MSGADWLTYANSTDIHGQTRGRELTRGKRVWQGVSRAGVMTSRFALDPHRGYYNGLRACFADRAERALDPPTIVVDHVHAITGPGEGFEEDAGEAPRGRDGG